MDRKFTFFLIGFIFWLVGVVAIRFLAPIVTGSLGLHLVFLGVAFLSSPITLILIAKLTGRTKHDMLMPLVLMTMPSMFLDSLAVSFDGRGLTNIYANTPALSAYAGGALLMAFWSLYLFALIWHRPQTAA